MATSVPLMCSPVDSSRSISRGSGSSVMAAARSRRWSVVSPMALTTTTRSAPARRSRAMRAGDVADAFGIGQRGAAVLLDDETGHARSLRESARRGAAAGRRRSTRPRRSHPRPAPPGRAARPVRPRAWARRSMAAAIGGRRSRILAEGDDRGAGAGEAGTQGARSARRRQQLRQLRVGRSPIGLVEPVHGRAPTRRSRRPWTSAATVRAAAPTLWTASAKGTCVGQRRRAWPRSTGGGRARRGRRSSPGWRVEADGLRVAVARRVATQRPP